MLRSRDKCGLSVVIFGLGLGLGLTVVGLGLGLGLMNNWSRVSYVLVSWSQSDKCWERC